MLLGTIVLAAFLVPKIIKAVSDYYPEVIMKYRMPIIYVWLGGSLPLRYKKRLEWVTFPYKLVGEADWEQLAGDFKNENLTTIERSDIMRLLYLWRYGGLYADFDMLLNYDCLMSTVAKFKGFMTYHSWIDANAIMFSDQEYNQDIKYALG